MWTSGTEVVEIRTITKPAWGHSCSCISLSVTTQTLLPAALAGYNEECQRCQEASHHVWCTHKETFVMRLGIKKMDSNSGRQPLFCSSAVRKPRWRLEVTCLAWQSSNVVLGKVFFDNVKTCTYRPEGGWCFSSAHAWLDGCINACSSAKV